MLVFLQKESEAEPTTFEKLTTLPAISKEEEMEKVERVLSNMNVQELVDFVKVYKSALWEFLELSDNICQSATSFPQASTVLEAGVPVLEESEVTACYLSSLF